MRDYRWPDDIDPKKNSVSSAFQGLAFEFWLLRALLEFHAHQLGHEAPGLRGAPPDGNGMQGLDSVKITFVQGQGLVEKDIADEFAFVAADDVRAILLHTTSEFNFLRLTVSSVQRGGP